MDENQNLEANQIGSDSSKKEDNATTTSLYNNNRQPQPPVKSPRPPPSSPATKKFASVARSFIRAVFCSPVKNEQKSIRKLSNPEAAAEATEAAGADDAVAMPPAAAPHRRHYQRNHGFMEQVETCSNRHRQRCVSEVYKPKLTLSSRNQMSETCSQGILFYV